MHYLLPGRDSAPYDVPYAALPSVDQAHHHIPARDHRHHTTHRRAHISSQAPRHADAYRLCLHPLVSASPPFTGRGARRVNKPGQPRPTPAGHTGLHQASGYLQEFTSMHASGCMQARALASTPCVCACLVLNLDTKYVHVRLPFASKDANPTVSM